MRFFAFFTNGGTPALLLNPTIDIWDHLLNHPIIAQPMTEIAGGWYQYNWPAYDGALDYVIRADGGVALPAFERYTYSSNENTTFAHVTEGALTFEEMTRIMFAVLAGLSGGGGTPTLNFRNLANTANRVNVQVDPSGNRLVIVLNGA